MASRPYTDGLPALQIGESLQICPGQETGVLSAFGQRPKRTTFSRNSFTIEIYSRVIVSLS